MIVMFCGHREIHDRAAVTAWLVQTCEKLIEEGAAEFFLGGYGEFDLLTLRVLKEMKAAHPQIRLILVHAYLNSKKTAAGCDETIYPPLERVPQRLAIIKRNEWCVERADAVVAYVMHGWGSSAKTLEYARRKKKQIISYAIASQNMLKNKDSCSKIQGI